MRFRILIICIISALAAYAQNVADTTAVVTIVERLQQPQSAVGVDAPEALLLRALPAAESEQQENENPTEEATEETDTEKPRNTRAGKAVGYRVQVFADNNARTAKTEARQRERAISQAFPEYGTYVSYASPYWRLRVGDFRSQYEADKAATEIKRQFPRYAREVRVVRDRVNVR